MVIKEIIRKIRLKAQMSRKEFSQALGTGYPTTSAWESGRNRPNYQNIRKIIAFAKDNGIEVSIEEFVG